MTGHYEEFDLQGLPVVPMIPIDSCNLAALKELDRSVHGVEGLSSEGEGALYPAR